MTLSLKKQDIMTLVKAGTKMEIYYKWQHDGCQLIAVKGNRVIKKCNLHLDIPEHIEAQLDSCPFADEAATVANYTLGAQPKLILVKITKKEAAQIVAKWNGWSNVYKTRKTEHIHLRLDIDMKNVKSVSHYNNIAKKYHNN